MKHLATIIFIVLFVNHHSANSQEKSLNLRVDASMVLQQMKGGIGASWHALVKDIPLGNEKYNYPAISACPRGSAFAGNPPLSDTAAWNQLYYHARWLGLNFVRVELSQGMYEPERNIFDWNNEEMNVLYKILDWCESNHADVFLQQMWGHVAWNSFPGVHPLISSPKSLDDFANGIATFLKHLTVTRKYTCIKYFCMTNEPPGGPWGSWWSSGDNVGPSITDAWKKLHETFIAQGIKIPISGPDWTSLPPFDASKIDFDEYLGSYDIHSYDGISNKDESKLNDWIQWAHQHNKPLFLSEFGNMSLGWGGSNPGPKSFAAALSNASDVISGINLGADGFNRWSFTNRGDLDGQWQLVCTYDTEKKAYRSNVIPENAAYYGFAMLSRFMGKYASMLSWETDYCIDGVKPTVIRNRDGNIVLLFVNNRKNAVDVNLTIKGVPAEKIFQLYQVTDELVAKPSFRLDPLRKVSGLDKSQVITLLPESLTVFTTYCLNQDDLGVIE